jgi:hypothetical protein
MPGALGILASSFLRPSSFGFRHSLYIRHPWFSALSKFVSIRLPRRNLGEGGWFNGGEADHLRGNFSGAEQLLLHACSLTALMETATPIRPAPTNAPWRHAPKLTSFRLFLTGINARLRQPAFAQGYGGQAHIAWRWWGVRRGERQGGAITPSQSLTSTFTPTSKPSRTHLYPQAPRTLL